MLEADELCNQIAIINKGGIIASGMPSEIKRRFSKVTVIEITMRQSQAKAVENLKLIRGIERVISGSDGLLQKLTLDVLPGAEVREEVTRVLGQSNIESVVLRAPTLEEAYLSVLK